MVLCEWIFCFIFFVENVGLEDGQDDESDLLEDSFGLNPVTSSSIDGMNHAVPLPIFQVEPEDAYALKNNPATLQCKAMHALQLNFKCNGLKNSSANANTFDFVDPQTGIRNLEAIINITRDEVEAYFHKDGMKCECVAMSSRGQIKSRPATVVVACKYCICMLSLGLCAGMHGTRSN